MIEVTQALAIDEKELQFDFVRASGPGGQNVNKVSTAVQLRFDVLNSPSLPEDVRQRLLRLAGSRINLQGILVIEARQARSQEQNRQEALQRLVKLVRQAAQRPKRRHKTRPSAAARQRRLDEKHERSQTKQRRRYRPDLGE